jgi:uncharacterized OB-fold protein
LAEAEAQQRMTMKQQREALREGKIVGQECAVCGDRHFVPVLRCVNNHDQFRIKEFATTGTVVTYTIQVVAPEAFLNEVPFAWAVVELDEGGPRVSGWIPFVSRPEELPPGQRVRYTPSYKPGMMFEKA